MNNNKKPKNKKDMSTTINPLIKSVSIESPETGVQEVTVILRYTGQIDLQGQINQDEELSIEIPSHAPPPEE